MTDSEMGKINDRELTVGRVYAEAILHLAVAAGEGDAVLSQLRGLADQASRDPSFATFLESPEIDQESRRAILERACSGRLGPLLLDALQVINRRQRLNLLPAIAEAYRQLLHEHQSVVDVEVVSAVPLDADQRRDLEAAVGSLLGGTPRLHERVDPAILGGLRLSFGGRQIDTSVATRLRRIGALLRERASREIHSETSYWE